MYSKENGWCCEEMYHLRGFEDGIKNCPIHVEEMFFAADPSYKECPFCHKKYDEIDSSILRDFRAIWETWDTIMEDMVDL